jgi:hypothetical protein
MLLLDPPLDMYGFMILNYYVLYVVCMLCHVCVVQCIIEFKSSLELVLCLLYHDASTLNKTYLFTIYNLRNCKS